MLKKLSLILSLSILISGCSLIKSIFNNNSTPKVQTPSPSETPVKAEKLETVKFPDGTYRGENPLCNGAPVKGDYFKTQGIPLYKMSGEKVTLSYTYETCQIDIPFELKNDPPGVFTMIPSGTIKCSNNSICEKHIKDHFRQLCDGPNKIANVMKYSYFKKSDNPLVFSGSIIDGSLVCAESNSGTDPLSLDLVRVSD